MQRSLNLGILAHVDAGKTSLTERILYNAGVIRTIGSVDHGTTQTDTLDLERQRGITIRAAITAFRIDDLTINLIDTPGHADFIAEVERAIGVLDAVILVVSAVEGVQSQTRRLSRAIAGLGLPCLIFVNKIDRVGARSAALIEEIGRELQRDLVVLTDVTDIGTSGASVQYRNPCLSETIEHVVDVLSRHDDDLLERYVEGNGALGEREVMHAMRAHVTSGRVTPIAHGSAITGAGIDTLFRAIVDFLPPCSAPREGPISAEVFNVQRLTRGERVVLCRVWSGVVENRTVLPIVRPHGADGTTPEPAKVTGIDGFRDGGVEPWQEAPAGAIVRLHGLPDARIGDWLGEPMRERVSSFEPPAFESRVEPAHPEDRIRLNSALAELADQDPFIGVRRDPITGETFVHLYGEVQQQVIEATLANDYGVAATFGEPTVVYVERLRGAGRAAEIFPDTKPPFYATVGFRIAPQRGEQSTWHYTPGKARQGFFDAAEVGGRSVLEQGMYGWPVIDWDVDVTHLIYLVRSVPVDYRRLAMLVMADAIRDAGTVVCEPVHEVEIRVPQDAVGAIIHLLSIHRGSVVETDMAGSLAVVRGTIPAREMRALSRSLPGLTNGRFDLATRFSDYVPVAGEPPVRRRTDMNPFDRDEFMLRLSGKL